MTPDWIDARKATPAIPAPYWIGKLSEVVEVTDGARTALAHYREADSVLAEDDDEIWFMSGFVDPDGEDLDWKPTHWRPIALPLTPPVSA